MKIVFDYSEVGGKRVKRKEVQRIRWIGHIAKVAKQRTVKRITEWRPIAARRIGGQRSRWEDDVRQVLGKMKIQNWSKMAMDGEEWKRIAE